MSSPSNTSSSSGGDGSLSGDLLRSVKEIAAFLGFSERSVYNLVEKGAIPITRLPGVNTIFARKSELTAAFQQSGLAGNVANVFSPTPRQPVRRGAANSGFITFEKMAEYLAAMAGISWDKRTAFHGRLKNLHRLGFVEASGRGRTVFYSFDELFRHAVAVEMISAGMRPAEIVASLTTDWAEIYREFNKARADEPVILCVFPLAFLGESSAEPFGCFQLAFNMEQVFEAVRDETRALIINLGRVFGACTTHMSSASAIDARSDETAQQAHPEGQVSGAQSADAQPTAHPSPPSD